MSKKRVNLGSVTKTEPENVSKQASIFDFVDENSTIFTIADKQKVTLNEHWKTEQIARQSLFEAQVEKAYIEAIEVLKNSMHHAVTEEGYTDHAAKIRAATVLVNMRLKLHDKTYEKCTDAPDTVVKHIHVNDGFNFSR